MRLNVAAQLAALFLVGCNSAPASFADADPSITRVDATGEFLNLRIEKPQRAFESSVIMEVGQVVIGAAKAIQAGVPGVTPATKTVHMDVRFGSPDAPDRFGRINFPIEALRGVDTSKIDAGSIMNLAVGYESGSGESAEDAARSCIENSTFVATAEGFCTLMAVEAQADRVRK